MIKPIFDEDVDFFSKKIILSAKGGDFKKGALDSVLCLSTLNGIYLNLINQRNVSHIKLSKYCDIDARLAKCQTVATLAPVYSVGRRVSMLQYFDNLIWDTYL